MSGATAIATPAWAFGPKGASALRDRVRPFGVAAGVLASIGLAGAIGFVAFVKVAGSDDPAVPAASAPVEISVPEVVVPQPLHVTDLRLTDAVDAATGEPARQLTAFDIGEPVHLWLSFDAGDHTGPLTAVWFRGHSKIARVQAPLPDAASQMVFPLPEVAVDRPGWYRVEVRSDRDVLAAESFEVTHA